MFAFVPHTLIWTLRRLFASKWNCGYGLSESRVHREQCAYLGAAGTKVQKWYLVKYKYESIKNTYTDMEFVKNFTPPDSQAKNFTPLISPIFNSFGHKNTKKWVKIDKFTPLAKILHCRRQWREWQIPPLPTESLRTQDSEYVVGLGDWASVSKLQRLKVRS